jgi:hypothetical protein
VRGQGSDADASHFSNQMESYKAHIDLQPRSELFSFDEATDVGT